jgi:hypothetical protein
MVLASWHVVHSAPFPNSLSAAHNKTDGVMTRTKGSFFFKKKEQKADMHEIQRVSRPMQQQNKLQLGHIQTSNPAQWRRVN